VVVTARAGQCHDEDTTRVANTHDAVSPPAYSQPMSTASDGEEATMNVKTQTTAGGFRGI
jgi:hypothetical protein